MFCKHCGKELPQNASACPDCGTKVKKYTPKKVTRPDKKSPLHTVIGFFFPVIGLILYLVQKDICPLRAKSAGKGALLRVAVNFALFLLYVCVFFPLTAALQPTSSLLLFWQ